MHPSSRPDVHLLRSRGARLGALALIVFALAAACGAAVERPAQTSPAKQVVDQAAWSGAVAEVVRQELLRVGRDPAAAESVAARMHRLLLDHTARGLSRSQAIDLSLESLFPRTDTAGSAAAVTPDVAPVPVELSDGEWAQVAALVVRRELQNAFIGRAAATDLAEGLRLCLLERLAAGDDRQAALTRCGDVVAAAQAAAEIETGDPLPSPSPAAPEPVRRSEVPTANPTPDLSWISEVLFQYDEELRAEGYELEAAAVSLAAIRDCLTEQTLAGATHREANQQCGGLRYEAPAPVGE